jgi:hypothetical protein
MDKKLLFLITVVILFISGWLVYTLLLNPAHRKIENEKGININAETLYQSFLSNEKTANATYLEKAVEVTGNIGSISKNADSSLVIFLQTSDPIFGVNCTMEGEAGGIMPGDTVRLKGICSGFINDVVLIRCHVVKK